MTTRKTWSEARKVAENASARERYQMEHGYHPRPADAIAAPLTPQSPTGRCGRCDGLLATDTTLNADVCMNCGRVAMT